MSVYAIPAQAAGFVSLFGSIEKGTGDALNLPEGLINIGGNGQGYILQSKTDWDPVSNNDGGFASLALGDDIYVYAVQDGSGVAQWIASKNSTYPDGYDATNSRKVGGFHYGRYRGVANRYDEAYDPVTQIVPNSCWDLQHRPTCDPTGMVEVIPGKLWVDIYLNSEGSGTWPENVPVSKYGATPIKDDVYARVDFHLLAANAGKRIPTVMEFLTYAEGCLEGNDGDNLHAWSNTGNSGPTSTGDVAKAISMFNVVDAAGNLYDWLDAYYDRASSSESASWDATVVDVGKDSGEARGQVNHVKWSSLAGGGNYNHGVYCGARCLGLNPYPHFANGNNGLRCVCDAL